MFVLVLLGGFDFAVKFAMALLLTCKSKTWGPYCCGYCIKVLCIRLVYDPEGMVYGFVAIALFHICMIKSLFNKCAQSCDSTTTLTISDNVALLRGNALFFRCAPGSLVMRRSQVRFEHSAATARY